MESPTSTGVNPGKVLFCETTLPCSHCRDDATWCVMITIVDLVSKRFHGLNGVSNGKTRSGAMRDMGGVYSYVDVDLSDHVVLAGRMKPVGDVAIAHFKYWREGAVSWNGLSQCVSNFISAVI